MKVDMENNITAAGAKTEHAVIRYKIHWHVILIHFPISFFVASFGFQVLHLFFAPACFELATNVALIAGATMMIPTTLSGWLTWKKGYKGANVPLFQRKIITSFIMLGLSLILVIWRILFLGLFKEVPTNPEHWIYMVGNIVLIVGAILEGYYGGLLNHR